MLNGNEEDLDYDDYPNNGIGKEYGVDVYLVGEDTRYPTLVINGSNGISGYSLDPANGKLTHVCICAAKCDYDCMCTYSGYGSCKNSCEY